MIESEDATSSPFPGVIDSFGSLNAEFLARRYDEHLAAVWRGEAALDNAFARWLETHWSATVPDEPSCRPEAVSVLGAAGSGIRWYTVGDAVVGFVGKRPDGCYRVPVSETPPPRAMHFLD